MALQLTRCSHCRAFLGPLSLSCPSCGRRSLARSIGAGLATLAASASVSVTLMACYGCPPGQCRDREGDRDAGEGQTGSGDGSHVTARPEVVVPDLPPALGDAGSEASTTSDAGAALDAGDASD